MRRMVSVKKVQVITHVETTDPSFAEKNTIAVKVTKRKIDMNNSQCRFLSGFGGDDLGTFSPAASW